RPPSNNQLPIPVKAIVEAIIGSFGEDELEQQLAGFLEKFATTMHDNAAVAEFFGVSTRTPPRWGNDPRMEFPDWMYVNGLPYQLGANLLAYVYRHRGKKHRRAIRAPKAAQKATRARAGPSRACP